MIGRSTYRCERHAVMVGLQLPWGTLCARGIHGTIRMKCDDHVYWFVVTMDNGIVRTARTKEQAVEIYEEELARMSPTRVH